MSTSDEGFIVGNQGFVEGHIENFNAIPFYLRRQFEKNCPTFVKFRSDVISRGLRRSQEVDLVTAINEGDPAIRLLKYSYSLYSLSLQALYSIERLDTISKWITFPNGANSELALYVSFYFSDFLSRIKTTTDVIALMVNQMFDLNVENKRCRLDGGAIANKLIAVYNDSGKKKAYIRQLSQSLEKARSDWIEYFYEIRNEVTHRDEFTSNTLPIQFVNEDHPRHSFSIHPDASDSTLIVFAQRVVPESLIFSDEIDPMILCEKLWEKLALLLDDVAQGCHPQIEFYIKTHAN